MIPIKYIGHRAVYVDGACGSGRTFEQGQTLLIDDESALKMLRHPSVYVRGDGDTVPDPVKEKTTDDDDPNQSMRDSIAQMNKDALALYAKSNFSVDLDKRQSVGNLRTQVTGLFDQFNAE